MALDPSRHRSCTRPRGAGPALRVLACCGAGLLVAGCTQLLGIEKLEPGIDAGTDPLPEPDTGPIDTTPPRILGITPAPDSVDVEPDAVLTVTFDEPVNPDALAASIEVRGPDDDTVGVVVNVQGNVATLDPEFDLSLLGTYTAVINTSVTDLAGNTLPLPQTWKFTVRDGVWGASDLIENNNAARSFRQQIAMDDAGNAIAVWDQNTTVWTNRYDVAKGWGTSVLLEPDMGGDARDARVGMDAQGNALAIWTQVREGRIQILTRRYDAMAGDWGAVTPIGNLGSGDAREPQLAMSPGGEAVAVWTQPDAGATRTSLWSSSYRADDGWTMPRLIENDDTESVVTPRVAISPIGSAMAVWTQDNGMRTRVWANFNVNGASWLVPEQLEPLTTGSSAQPHVAMDHAGNAVAVWQSGSNVKASRYSDSGWAEATVIMNNTEGPPFVAVEPRGNAVAAARHAVVSGRPGRMVAIHYYASGDSWDKQEVIGVIDINAAAAPPVVAMDPFGNALAVWDFHDADPIMLVAARFRQGSGWTPDAEIETPRLGQDPQIAINRQGKAWLTWGSRNGDFRRDINATPFH